MLFIAVRTSQLCCSCAPASSAAPTAGADGMALAYDCSQLPLTPAPARIANGGPKDGGGAAGARRLLVSAVIAGTVAAIIRTATPISVAIANRRAKLSR